MKKRTMAVILSVLVVMWIVSGCGGPASEVVSADSSAPISNASAPDTAPVAAADVEEPADEPLSEATATPEPVNAGDDASVLSDTLTEDYDDALSARNQLALGTLRLAETNEAVTVSQVQDLLFYWQALKALTAESTAAVEETSAVQDQIFETMTPEQLAAVQRMGLTNADLTTYYTEMGIEVTTPDSESTSEGTGGGSMRGLTPEEREAAKATATALGTPVGTGSGSGSSRRDVLLDAVIDYLSNITPES